MAEPTSDLRAEADGVADKLRGAADGLAERAREVEEEYEGDEERPLGGYVVLMATYLCAVAAAALVLRRRRAALPAHLSWSRLLIGGLATHRLSRLLTKDPITSPIRAPFTRYDGLSGPAELREQVRTTGGLGHAVGELLTCPFCIAQWAATAFAIGWIVAPRATDVAAGIFATVGLADLLHLAYERLEG